MTNQATANQNSDGYVKVHMYGERPWVYQLKQEGNKLIGRVDNKLLCTHLHGYAFNDVVEFVWDETFNCWEASKKLLLKVVQ